jgi:nucleotide-binding universal stress UspA family protein
VGGMSEATSVQLIVVGDDGSDGADRAIRFTAIVAGKLGAEVVLVKAYSPLDDLGSVEPPVDFKQLEAEAQRVLETERGAPLRDAGVVFRALLVEDPDAIGVLSETARDCDADLVVVGSHGQTGWRERILGNVATKLPHELDCPITIVPAPKRLRG